MKQIEWYRQNIEWSNKEIEWLNSMIEMEREEMKKIQVYVWSKGVLDEFHMKMYGIPNKPAKSVAQKKYEADRNKEYRNRKKYERYIKEYEARLAKL